MQVNLTWEVPDKQAAVAKLQQIKDKVKGSGVKLSASFMELLEKPTDQ